MTIGEAIKASYALPLIKWRDALRAFWPLVLAVAANIVLMMGGLSIVPTMQMDEVTAEQMQSRVAAVESFVLVMVPAVLYLAFLTARGAVSWHRGLILGTPVPITPPWPNGRAIVYGMLVVLIGIAQALLQAFVVIPIVLGFIGSPAEIAAGVVQPNSPTALAIVIVSYVAYAFAITVLAGLMMSLPGTALKGAQGAGSGERYISRRYVAWVVIGTTFVIPFAITMLSTVLNIQSALFLVVIVVLQYYASLVALTGLSMAYRYGTWPERLDRLGA